jgi:uncharacterized membrane protein YbhN (UPF0104 family)
LPIVVLIEIGLVGIDVVSVRVLVGDAKNEVPARTWIRGAVLAYASSVLLPTGRAAGEAVRAAVLAPVLGITRATRACGSLQACALVANAAISLVGASVAWSPGGPGRVLTLALCSNALVCGALAIGLFAILRNGRFANWMRRRFPRLGDARLASLQPPSWPPMTGTACTLCVVVRLLEACQYGVVLRSLGSPLAVHGALTAQGIHLVGAAVGDFIPNQMGVTEGSYVAFADVLGLAGEGARAISIALIAHIVQLGLAIVFLLAGALIADHRALPDRCR